MFKIVPLTKSPFPHKGRTGKPEWQDWYCGIELAATLAKENPGSKIIVISAVHIKEVESEADLYLSKLLALEVPASQIQVIREAWETIGQIEKAMKVVGPGNQIIFITAPLHYFRVLWLTRKSKVWIRVRIGWGLPRIKEVFTDFFLMFLFPLIDLLGGRQWFKKLVTTRRQKGKQF